LAIQTNGTTQAVSISTGQVATLAQNPILTSGTANGVAYLNGSKVLTTGSALSIYGSVVNNTGSSPSFRSTFTGGAYYTSLFPDGIYAAGTDLYLSAPASKFISFYAAGAEKMRLDASGNLGLGVTPSAWNTAGGAALQVKNASLISYANADLELSFNSYYDGGAAYKYIANGFATRYDQSVGTHIWYKAPSGTAGNAITFTQAMTLDASGNLLVGKTAVDFGVAGVAAQPSGVVGITRSGGVPLIINRLASDGDLVNFQQDGTLEGSISVSGTTVSYNGGHLSRWAQTSAPKDESLLKGTVLSNLDEMNIYTDAEGNPVSNEQLNKVKVSDVEGDANVAGVFVNWTHDDAHDVDEINMAMTGDMIIRIAQGTTVARGDLLMSAGDGTAKPQGDDIVRSKTVAKVTSTHVTCTYSDGSYCVPCVLMAC
jgi:hypothetical protein